MTPIGVACVGLATADTIVELPTWPEPDGRMVADSIVRSYGGPAATAAVTLSRLGHRAAMIGAVGDDRVGELVRRDLADEGVDVTHLATSAGRSAESVIVVERARSTRTILHAPGASPEGLGSAARELCASAAWTHVDHAGFGLVDGVDRGRLSVDAGHRMEGLELAGVGLYAPSATALRDRYPNRPLGSAVAAALADGARRVAVTLGARGALAAAADGAWHVRAAPIEVVSTLGAGDVFHGALLASMLDGLSLAEAVRRANVAAALSCRSIDGRGAIPTREELDAALAGAPPVESVMLDAIE